jgi:hypothetical protein
MARGLAVLAILAAGCSSSASNPDATHDRLLLEAGHDTRAPDTSHVDAPRADQSAPVCSPGLSLSPLSLAPDYCVTRRLKLPASYGAFALRGDSLWTFSGHTTTTVGELKGEVQRWPIDPKSGALGASTVVFSFSEVATVKIFASEYLAAAPGSAGPFAVGFTLDKTFEGAIYRGSAGGAPQKIGGAQGNFDALFLDDKTLLVNGFGAESAQLGQGVYLLEAGKPARRLIKDLGAMSGYLALGTHALFAGGYFTDGSKLYGLSLAELNAAIAGGKELSASADGDLVYSGSALDAAALGDDLVIARVDTSFAFDGVSVVPVTVSGDKVTATTQTPQPIVTEAAGATVDRLATDGAQLGLLLTASGQTELAVVQHK